MKFVFFGYDFSLNIVQRLIEDGHDLVGVFTFECDNIFNFNRDLIAYAAQHDAPVVISQPEDIHIDAFLAEGAEVFIAAGYPFKIPPVDETRAYAINVHPSLLPKGRGVMPTPHIIMHAPEAGGVSAHKMTQKFDGGDILYQEKIMVDDTTTVETYSDQIAQRNPEILSMIMHDLSGYWERAKAQNEDEATYFKMPGDDMRMMDWEKSIKDIDKTGRAFGHFGSLAKIDGTLHAVYDYEIEAKDHNHTPGTIANQNDEETVIAAKDGFVRLKKLQKLP